MNSIALHPNTPVIVGVGQTTVHWASDSGAEPPDPQSLRFAAAANALADSGAGARLAQIIDRVVVVRTMADSVPGAPQPYGRCANPAGTLASDLRLTPAERIYSAVGGDQPQALVNESAEAIFHGAVRAVLLAGSEATAALKQAIKAGQQWDWSRSTDDDYTDRGLGQMLLSRYDIANGLGAPTQTYPAFEHALAARLGGSRSDHRARMSALWSGFSAVAAMHPDAQFPVARSADFLSTPSADNYAVAEPYLKWDVAQDAVNQGAAVILTSTAEADRLGIPPSQRVYLHGHAAAHERVPSERADLSRAWAINAALGLALDSSGIGAAQLDSIDLYSCFPVAVLLAAEALGHDPRAISADEAKALTVTGGLPFFGGAGNNYSMHAIVTMAKRLRTAPGTFGLVLANGGFLSKQAAGIYSTLAPADWQPVSSSAIQRTVDAEPVPRLLTEDCTGTIESWSVSYAKGEPARGYAFIRTNDGARALARTTRGEAARFAAFAAAAGDPIGRPLSITHADGVNSIVVPA